MRSSLSDSVSSVIHITPFIMEVAPATAGTATGAVGGQWDLLWPYRSRGGLKKAIRKYEVSALNIKRVALYKLIPALLTKWR